MNSTLARRLLPRFVQLEAKIDQTLFRGYNPEEDHKSRTPLVAAGGAAGLGGYLAHRGVMKNYGGEIGGVKEAYRNAGRDVARRAQEAGSQIAEKTGAAIESGKAAIASGKQTASAAIGSLKQRVTSGAAAARVSWGRNSSMGRPLLEKLVRGAKSFKRVALR